MTDEQKKQLTNDDLRAQVWAMISARIQKPIEKVLEEQPILAEVWFIGGGKAQKLIVQQAVPFSDLRHLIAFALFQNEDEIRCYALPDVVNKEKIAPHRITISKLAPNPIIVLEQMAMKTFIDLVGYELIEDDLPAVHGEDEEEEEDEDEEEEEQGEGEGEDEAAPKRRRALDG